MRRHDLYEILQEISENLTEAVKEIVFIEEKIDQEINAFMEIIESIVEESRQPKQEVVIRPRALDDNFDETDAKNKITELIEDLEDKKYIKLTSDVVCKIISIFNEEQEKSYLSQYVDWIRCRLVS